MPDKREQGGLVERSSKESAEALIGRGFQSFIAVKKDDTEVEIEGMGKVGVRPADEVGMQGRGDTLTESIADAYPAGYGFSWVPDVETFNLDPTRPGLFEDIVRESPGSLTVFWRPLA